MKNRFFIFNKEKIYAYIVSIMTIFVIFFMSNIINNDINNTEEVSSNVINNITTPANFNNTNTTQN